ncbi:para-nitrobenzyl esterase [Lophiotrema nucula]|uniref:Carboxylic ester hydrolase n=1 Tax=Lophiotrema nucula TaxID=690887 RepID=A0A6A5ZVT6_9PLEO|nr:para-nitrobenzyl esterase [Lophiotrema nucula]
MKMKLLDLRQAVLLLACSVSTRAVESVVDIGYSKYRGRVVGDGTTQWLGMRFAAPPVGNLRFAAPQDPIATTGILDASKFGPICYASDPTDWTNKPSKRFTISEDCLYLNVFAPSDATTGSKLPVMFFIQGGGFNSNSNNNFNGSDIVREGNITVVSINYRVGPYGFLQSQEVLEDASLNNGVRDMIKALKWVGENIKHFGGNPKQVIINGDSAGAAAIAILLTSPATRTSDLFVGSIAESTPENNFRTLERGQKQYSCLLQAAGCTNSTSSLACLRSLNVTALQTTTCSFGPGEDTDISPNSSFAAFEAGEYLHVPTIWGSTADEGTKSAPESIDTAVQANALLSKSAPFSNNSLELLDQLYIYKNETVFPNAGRKWRNAANYVGDAQFHCPTRVYQNILLKDGVPTWNYHYKVEDPEQEAEGIGAYHTVELNAVWGPNNTDGNPPKSYYTTNAPVVPLVRSYWTSFVKHLDPNKERLEGAPVWKQWDEERARIRFRTNDTAMEAMSQSQNNKCEILDPLVRALDKALPDGELIELHL